MISAEYTGAIGKFCADSSLYTIIGSCDGWKFSTVDLCMEVHWGVATQKNEKKKRKKPKKKTEKKTEKKPKKKPVPNLKFAVAFGFFRFFSFFFRFFFRYFSVFCGTFSVFFGLNFDKKFQPFKNHVNNQVFGGQELPNNTLNA